MRREEMHRRRVSMGWRGPSLLGCFSGTHPSSPSRCSDRRCDLGEDCRIQYRNLRREKSWPLKDVRGLAYRMKPDQLRLQGTSFADIEFVGDAEDFRLCRLGGGIGKLLKSLHRGGVIRIGGETIDVHGVSMAWRGRGGSWRSLFVFLACSVAFKEWNHNIAH